MTEALLTKGLAIEADRHVTIRYAIYEEGQSEATAGAEELTDTYVHGYGQVFPALEQGLEGELAGAHVSLIAEPGEAFGEYEADGVFEIEKDGLDGADTLAAGEEVVASGPDGDILMRVVEVRDETLLVDTNHPLAGKRVRFEVDIVEVRQATEDEIEEAQEDLEEDADACGCGHSHDDGEAHVHAASEDAPAELVQLGLGKQNAKSAKKGSA